MKKGLLLSSAVILILGIVASGTFAFFSDTETSLENTFTSWASKLWTQTSYDDFYAGVLNNVDITTSPGDVMLAISNDGFVRDDFNNYDKVASTDHVAVVGGVVQLSSDTPPFVRTERPIANNPVAAELIPYPTGTPNWDCVNDATPDYDVTYVSGGTANAWKRDLYRLPNFGSTGAVTNVTVHFVARSEADNPTAMARAVMYTSSGGATLGPDIQLESVWQEYVVPFPYAPGTTTPWAVGTLNGASVGIELRSASGNKALCTQIYVQVNFSGTYYSSGTLTSKNLLAGMCNTIDSFTYYAPLIPTGTNMRVRFSQDGTSWFSSTNVASGWDTMSAGTHIIDLTGLHWSGSFYYMLELSTTNYIYTPVLDYIIVHYSYYFASGSIASKVFDTTVAGATWDAFIWDETLLSGTDITFEVRASDGSFAEDDALPDWEYVGGTSPVTSGLPSGQHKQWRATLGTETCGNTPILHEVRVWYDP